MLAVTAYLPNGSQCINWLCILMQDDAPLAFAPDQNVLLSLIQPHEPLRPKGKAYLSSTLLGVTERNVVAI